MISISSYIAVCAKGTGVPLREEESPEDEEPVLLGVDCEDCWAAIGAVVPSSKVNASQFLESVIIFLLLRENPFGRCAARKHNVRWLPSACGPGLAPG